MIDRFGKTVRVAWSESEMIWLHAAITLKGGERTAAFRDIADMTGRTLGNVRHEGYRLECKQQQDFLSTSQISPASQFEKMTGKTNTIRPSIGFRSNGSAQGGLVPTMVAPQPRPDSLSAHQSSEARK